MWLKHFPVQIMFGLGVNSCPCVIFIHLGFGKLHYWTQFRHHLVSHMDKGNLACRKKKRKNSLDNICCSNIKHEQYCICTWTHQRATCTRHLLCRPHARANHTSAGTPAQEAKRAQRTHHLAPNLDTVHPIHRPTKRILPAQRGMRRILTAISDPLHKSKWRVVVILFLFSSQQRNT